MIIAAKTGRRMQISASFCTGQRSDGDAAVRRVRFPGWATTGVARGEAGQRSRRGRRGGGRSCTRRSTALPFVDGEHLLDAGEGDERVAGTVTTAPPPGHDDLRAGEGARPQRARRSLGTSASTSSVRFCSLIGGREARDAALGARPASPSTVTRTRLARRARSPPRARARRAGAAAGDADERHHRRARGEVLAHGGAPLAHRAVDRGDASTVSASCWRASSSSERRCSEHGLPVAHLLERVLVAPLRHAQPRDRRCRARPARSGPAAAGAPCDRG